MHLISFGKPACDLVAPLPFCGGVIEGMQCSQRGTNPRRTDLLTMTTAVQQESRLTNESELTSSREEKESGHNNMKSTGNQHEMKEPKRAHRIGTSHGAKAHRISNKPHNLDLGAVHLQSGYGNQLRTFHPCKRSEEDFF